MSILLSLLPRLIPFYISIFIGYLAGKYLHTNRENIGTLLIYIITPIIVFHAIVSAPLSYQSLTLPLVFFIVASSVCLLFYFIGKKFWSDTTINILAYAVGSANTGYFGLPLAIALWGNDVFNTVILCMLGMVIYDSTIGFFIVAKNEYDTKTAIQKVLQLPALYAVIAALVCNAFHIHSLGPVYEDYIKNAQGAFTILGPMLIGIAFGHRESYQFDFKALFSTFTAKFIIWPIFIGLFVFLDITHLHLFSNLTHKVIMLLSMGPFAANTVALATTFHVHPQKASALVMLSVLFAFFYIPSMLLLFGSY